jgi:hypothetical protein
VRGHQHHPKRVCLRIGRCGLGSEHHRDVDIAGKVSQPFGMAWVGKTCEVKCVLVGRGCNDTVDLAAEGEPYRRLDRVARDPAGADDAITILVRIATAEPPASNRDSTLRRYPRDLVLRAHDGNLGPERFSQSASRNLGPDAPGISQRYRQPRPSVLRLRPSRLSPQDLIST